jgi:hypothetical protein
VNFLEVPVHLQSRIELLGAEITGLWLNVREKTYIILLEIEAIIVRYILYCKWNYYLRERM